MSLSNIKKMKGERGFTIVELLIVIVVIAVLAAIVFVAYQGITNNARNSNYKSNAASIQKVAEVIHADTGSYPATESDFTNGSDTTKLPTGISVELHSGTAPTNNAAFNTARITAADGDPPTYLFDSCTSGGLKIYYPVRGASAAEVISIGDVSADC